MTEAEFISVRDEIIAGISKVLPSKGFTPSEVTMFRLRFVARWERDKEAVKNAFDSGDLHSLAIRQGLEEGRTARGDRN